MAIDIWGLELGQWSLKGFNGSTCFRELDDYPVDISDVWLMVTHIRMGTQLYTSGSPLNGHFRNAHHFQTHSWAIG